MPPGLVSLTPQAARPAAYLINILLAVLSCLLWSFHSAQPPPLLPVLPQSSPACSTAPRVHRCHPWPAPLDLA